jgi:predicted nicotinamide N-methyase
VKAAGAYVDCIEVELLADLFVRPIRCQRPANLASRIDREALLRDELTAEPPYWAHLWPASLALARLVVASESQLVGKRVIDLGCGVGLAGVVASKLGGRVIFGDVDEETLVWVRRNLRINSVDGSPLCMDWRHAPFRRKFDVCLLADATYDPALHDALVRFLVGHLEAGGQFWIAESVRTADRQLRNQLAEHFEVVEEQLPELEEGHRVWVRLLRGWR